jgi:hypothetical protein
MKSAYRNVRKSLSPIKRLPVNDKTPAATVIRMQRMTTVWNRLPNPPGQATPFTIGELDQDGFEALLATLEAKLKLVTAAQAELDQQVRRM